MSLLDQAISAQQKGNLSEAEALFRRVLADDGRNFHALHRLGVVRAMQGNFLESEKMLREALAVDSNSLPCYHYYGMVLARLNRYKDAIEIFNKAILVAPDYAPLYFDRGNCEQALGRFREALASYDTAISLKSDFADAWVGRGNASFKLKRYKDALVAFDKALQLNRSLAGAWLGGGNVFVELNRHEDALAAYGNALALNPHFPHAWVGRGNVFFETKRYDDAFAAYNQALISNSGFADAWRGRGNVLRSLGRYDEALAAYDTALTLRPDFGDVRFDKAGIRLSRGDYEQGWQEYESRWDTQQLAGVRRSFAQPLWLGDTPLANKTILLHAEQGLGDTLFACRYVPMVAALGAKVIVEVQPPLVSLLRSLDGVSTLVGQGEKLPDFNVQCPLMSLPLAFKTRIETIPAKVPYLSAQTALSAKWRSRLGQVGPKIGVAWAGNPDFRKDRDRSISLTNILPIFSVEGARYFSLQKELRSGDEESMRSLPQLVQLGAEIADLENTAAIIASLDLIITVDSSLAHLAGALGKPVWILLARNPDWRWLLDRSDSPWYPTARLYRQIKDGDWSTVVDQIRAQLQTVLRS
jgi:tetratricopeptide (TPR) repeat protein